MNRRCALAITGTLCFIAVRADAGEAVSLGWVRGEGAESCASPRAVAAAVEQLLGGSAFVAPSRTEAAIEAEVTAIHGGWRADIRTTGSDGRLLGQRAIEVTASSCDALTVPATLAIALLIDPDAHPAATPPPAPPPIVTAAASKPALRPETKCPPPEKPAPATGAPVDMVSSRVRSAVAIDGGLAPGLLPGAAPFARLELQIALAPR